MLRRLLDAPKVLYIVMTRNYADMLWSSYVNQEIIIDDLSLEGYISVLMLSCFMWSGALDSSSAFSIMIYNNNTIAHKHHTN